MNLAAMPDLIFTVLFFFMIVTHMREVKPMVRFDIPQGTEVEKARKAGMIYLFIGKPVNERGDVVGDESRIQLNDHYVTLDEIGAAIEEERSHMSEENRQQMGLINDVKQALRKAGALNINYSATGVKKK